MTESVPSTHLASAEKRKAHVAFEGPMVTGILRIPMCRPVRCSLAENISEEHILQLPRALGQAAPRAEWRKSKNANI